MHKQQSLCGRGPTIKPFVWPCTSNKPFREWGTPRPQICPELDTEGKTRFRDTSRWGAITAHILREQTPRSTSLRAPALRKLVKPNTTPSSDSPKRSFLFVVWWQQLRTDFFWWVAFYERSTRLKSFQEKIVGLIVMFYSFVHKLH